MTLLPRPQSIEIQDEKFILEYDTNIVLDKELSLKELRYAKLLQKQIKDSLGFTLPVTKDEENGRGIFLQISGNITAGGYQLYIKEDRIVIRGGDSEGLLYGVQTLRQIIIKEGAVLSCLVIKDYPEIKARGFYHDVTRGRIPTLKTLKELADKISFYKLNQLQLYIEHSFLFKDFSEVWRDDTPLTAEEILELDQYCRDLNIELVPSIASFGHLYKVLSTRTYSDLCELSNSNQEAFSLVDRMEHHTINVTNERSFAFIKKMLSEYIPLFSSGKVNICGDETFDLGKDRSREMAEAIGTDRMYVEFLSKICSFIKDQGKRPMFWGDVILLKPEAIKELPENVICLNWDYNPEVSEDKIRKLYDLGVTQYVCPGVHGWNHLINRLDYAYGNISAMCKYAHTYHAAGLLNTDWGDYGHINSPELSVAGMIYGAVFSWNSDTIDFEEINKEISALEYRDRSESFIANIVKAARWDSLIWPAMVCYKENRVSGIPEDIMQNAPFAISDIRSAVGSVYQNMTFMDSAGRSDVKAYLIMAKGLMIFYSVLSAVGQYLNKKGSYSEKPAELAVTLEYWFKDYKELWRSSNKEGELFRIQEVIFWYADLLREIA